MTIPVDAVYYSGGNAYVYLYEDGKAKKASIEVGINDDDYVEVTGGLSADDLVVSTWSNNLYEGADIQLSGSGDGAGGETPAADNSAAGSSAAQEG